MSANKKNSDSKQEVYAEQNRLVCVLSAVSMMAAQEYDGMKEQLDLEQNLRVKAETYAHEVKKRAQKPKLCCSGIKIFWFTMKQNWRPVFYQANMVRTGKDGVFCGNSA